MSERRSLPGKFVWFEHSSTDSKKAQAFYAEVLGWKIRAFPMGSATYDMIFTGESLDTMIGGFGAPPRAGERSRWISSVSVEDVDAAAQAAKECGGTILAAPWDLPGIARSARIADPHGAEMVLFKRTTGDLPDSPAAKPGQFFWNELHTPDPTSALGFYEKVIGFSHREVGGPENSYFVVSKNGIDRGGVTSQPPRGIAPHWLPYVFVDDPDAATTRARALGGTILVGPADIPDIGRFGVLGDPTGAMLAVMKPLPMRK